MDQLWAPWRLAYAVNPKPKMPTAGEDCFLCRVLGEADDRPNLILLRTELAVVVLNRFPYNNGHLLVCPLAHKSVIEDLSDAESLELQRLLVRMTAALKKCIRPDGFNVGLNLGKVAGAGLPGHLHWHIVPRWEGDTNFMPVVADTKVIVQSLESLYDVLVPEL